MLHIKKVGQLENLRTGPVPSGDEPQIMPAISEKWVSYVNSRQASATVDVIEYK